MAMTNRRGVALLITLAALIVTVTAAATLAQLASTTRLQRRLHDSMRLADDLVLALAWPVEHWLAKESGRVVLPPDADEPVVTILHDLLLLDGHEIELRVTGWDQCGMASLAGLAAGSPLRLALDDDVLRRIDELDLHDEAPLGLDMFIDDVEIDDAANHVDVFPTASVPEDEPIVFTSGLTQQRELSTLRVQSQSPPAIGAMVSTHLRKNGRARINVNTAPMRLLESAMRLAGRGGIDVISEARREGRPVSLGALSGPRSSEDRQTLAPDLAGSSDAWAFRVDIRIDGLRRSWWIVYVSLSSNWECVQRLAIPQ